MSQHVSQGGTVSGARNAGLGGRGGRPPSRPPRTGRPTRASPAPRTAGLEPGPRHRARGPQRPRARRTCSHGLVRAYRDPDVRRRRTAYERDRGIRPPPGRRTARRAPRGRRTTVRDTRHSALRVLECDRPDSEWEGGAGLGGALDAGAGGVGLRRRAGRTAAPSPLGATCQRSTPPLSGRGVARDGLFQDAFWSAGFSISVVTRGPRKSTGSHRRHASRGTAA